MVLGFIPPRGGNCYSLFSKGQGGDSDLAIRMVEVFARREVFVAMEMFGTERLGYFVLLAQPFSKVY
jgi:hypothetical protein